MAYRALIDYVVPCFYYFISHVTHRYYMEKSMRIFAVFFVALLALASLCTAGAATPNAGPSPLLRLHRATFDARSQSSVTSSTSRDVRNPYAIIQLRGPI